MMHGPNAGISIASILFANNMVFMLFLGLRPILAPYRHSMATIVSCSTMSIAILVTNIACFCIDRVLLIPAEATVVHLLVSVVVALTVAQLIEVCMQRWYPLVYDQTGLVVPLVTIDTAIVGSTFLICSGNPFSGVSYTFLGCLVFALLNACGYIMARVIMECIHDRLGEYKGSGLLDGIPRILIACGLVSLVFLGLSGTVL